MAGFVYIMTNEPSGTLYIGVTSDLARRIWQHRNGSGSAFCRRHGLVRLVYVEPHGTIQEAIAGEKALKRWQRSWKPNLIGRANPEWRDLYADINK